MGISVALFPTDDRRVEITLADGGERDGFDLDAIGERRGRWIDYVAGTAWAMAESGAQIRGFRGLLASDLPAGAGLSSSAAFELEYVNHESGGSRVVVETAEWLAVVPFWAAWPFETLLVPKRPAARLFELDDVARDDLATVLPELLGRYDGLFKRPFPYSMGWHQAPFGDPPTDAWQVHAHFYMRKFMVGYELLAETQRDLTAEDAAARLRAVSGAGTPAIAAAPLANPA